MLGSSCAGTAGGEGRHHGRLRVRQGQARMGCPQASAVVAPVSGHAYHQATALQVLDDVDLVVRLHPGKNHAPRPKLLHPLLVHAVQMPPGRARECQLAVGVRALWRHWAALVVGIGPNQLAILHGAAKANGAGHNSAKPANGNACQFVVPGANHRAHGALLEALDGVWGVCLHLISEEKQAANAHVVLQLLSWHAADLVIGDVWAQILVGDAQRVVVLLGALHGDLVIVRWHSLRHRQRLDLLIAALDENLQTPGAVVPHHRPTGHAVVVELQLSHDAQHLPIRRSHLLVTQLPADGAHHRALHLVPDQLPSAGQLLHRVAGGQGAAQPWRHS
mmetsp:Transcript_6976/g.16608  ORF Transcript_6976/g.16608 Transcript_6976/m.16608 type:complete len:334 (-) Transcript_6976:1932-2933(-)